MTALNPRVNHSQSRAASVSSRLKDELAGSDSVSNPTNLGVDPSVSASLLALGMKNLGQVYRNLAVPALVEHALRRGEGQLSNSGALCVETGKYTGRSPKDRFIVNEPTVSAEVDWNQHNVPISEATFERLYQRALTYVAGRDLYVFDGYAGADPNYRFGVRVINEFAFQNLFAHQLFLRPSAPELQQHRPDFTVIALPGLQGNPELDGLHSEAFIILHLSKRIVLIGGSRYAGEIKKSVFSLLNYHMTKWGVLPMHSAANVGDKGDTALFFGLSGTGKTSLSVDGERRLIGDDEHGWSDDGIFNFEGGCYAKTIHLSQQHEPQIWSALTFGALLENVILDPVTRVPDYDNGQLTENTRAAYPLEHIPNCERSGVGAHPKTIIFLTADAFGVLPPIARLTTAQAMYHFLSGYTSKLAGTERGITTPQATFSACFGQCFFPLSPVVYAEMLGQRLQQHPQTRVFLINTGWSGGGYGVGNRIAIAYTRAMVAAALNGELEQVSYQPHPIFKVLVPTSVPGVPSHVLDPKQTWSDPAAYDQQAIALARSFAKNFAQFTTVSPEIAAAAPNSDA
ncbi:MAG: phosphoenolpyruvate carboxykinase (ATP) [Elainella sp. C42_A2020_010]|nr:phosphoenolpyruvate carboxykinase (ATP) [Elainella sp. C42_A2020_010]